MNDIVLKVPDVAEAKSECTTLCQRSMRLEIIDQTSCDVGVDVARGIKTARKALADRLDPTIKAAHQVHRNLCGLKSQIDEPLEDAERIVKGKIGRYQDEQLRVRREAEEAARAAARKIEENQRLAEAQRLEAIAVQARIEAQALAEAGKTREAEHLRAEAANRQAQADAVIDAPMAVVTVAIPPPPKLEGVSRRENWKFRIVDKALIPLEYMLPDEGSIGKVVRALKSQTNIPGVEVFAETVVSAQSY